MSHQSKTTRILLVSFVILALLGVGVGLDNFQVFAQADTCPDTAPWTKIEGLGEGVFTYTFNAPEGKLIDRVCYKNGTNLGYEDVSPSASSYTLDISDQQNSLSHVAYRVVNEPTSTEPPKEETPTPTVTVTEPPKESTPTPTVTVTEPPKEESPTPTGTVTEPPKESTPTPDPTDPPVESTESKPQVDPKPDQAAGGSGPSLGSLITLLVVSGASVGIVSYMVTKTKKKENIIQ